MRQRKTDRKKKKKKNDGVRVPGEEGGGGGGGGILRLVCLWDSVSYRPCQAAVMFSPRRIKSFVFARVNSFASFSLRGKGCEARRAKCFVFMLNSSRVKKVYTRPCSAEFGNST